MQRSILFAAASLMAAAAAIGASQASLINSDQPVIANDLHLHHHLYHHSDTDDSNQKQVAPANANEIPPNVNIPPAIYRIRPKPNKPAPVSQSEATATATASSSGRTVINGNHATYVEPPADFKPIIYEPEKQHVAAAAAAAAANANDLQSFDSSPPAAAATAHSSQQEAGQQQQQLTSSSSASLSVSVNGLSRQQHQQHQYQLTSANQNNRQPQQQPPFLPLPGSLAQSAQSAPARPDGEPQLQLQLQADKISHHHQVEANVDNSGQLDQDDWPAASQSPFKAPIGRWSDWHDMSDEPDLASSDNDPSQATYYFVAPPQDQVAQGHRRRHGQQRLRAHRQPSVRQVAAELEPTASNSYRTRYGATKGAPPQTQQVFFNPVYYPSDGQLIKGGHHQSAYEWRQSANGQQQHLASQWESTLAIKSVENVKSDEGDHLKAQHRTDVDIKWQQPPAALSAISLAATAAPPPPLQPSAMPMMVMPFNSNSNSNNHHHHQLSLQRAPPTGNLIKMQVVAESKAPLSVAPMSSGPQAAAPKKRIQAQLPVSKSEQVKSVGQVSGNEQSVAQQQQQQQPPRQAQLPSRRLKRRRKSKTSAEVRIQQLALESAGQASAPMLATQLAANNQVNGLVVAGGQLNGSPAVARLVAPAPAPAALAPSPGELRVLQPRQQPVASASAASNKVAGQTRRTPASSVVKRAAKRKPIRTLQPVGLTSWFLGGIRDLDARHWQLPADVINKLAVNDVDLQHADQAEQPNEVEKATVQPSSPAPPSWSSSSTTTMKLNRIPR